MARRIGHNAAQHMIPVARRGQEPILSWRFRHIFCLSALDFPAINALKAIA
jgi:hypothetical protein